LGILVPSFIFLIKIYHFADILDMQEKIELSGTIPSEEKAADAEAGGGLQIKETPESAEKEPRAPTFELNVSEDGLKAHLLVKRQGDLPLRVEEVNTFLKEKGISFGFIGDAQIEESIRTGILFRELCLVAEGTPPVPGRDAQLIYHFAKDPAKIGKIKQGGEIDFKDKGEIPQVEENALLVEKIPLIQETPGTDVYGKSIPVAKAKDCSLTAGPGTKRSTDGLSIRAKIWGRPEATPDNKISVSPALDIQGDVGLETGHIRFDGFVKVDGSIQEGFRVYAKKLFAQEIFRGEVEIEGDIEVDKGIIGARVAAKGNIKARFIHSSQVSAVGDVVVEKEIIDSKIETGGNLIAIPNGKVFTSQVAAKKGIATGQIGSESSKPCVLTIGMDCQAKEWIRKLREEISLKEKERAKIQTSVKQLNGTVKELEEKIPKLAQIKDKGLLEYNKFKEGVETLADGKAPSLSEQERSRLRQIEATIKKIAGELAKLMDQRDKIAQELSRLQDQDRDCEGAIEGLQQEIEKLTQDGSGKEVPSLKVYNGIFAGTTIQGLHCQIMLEETLLKATISEKKVTKVDPEGNKSTAWEMRLSDPSTRSS
jgi:uncharacterized protein (DUF342 family)